jgi:DNA-binding IclR family transcriptional regulator
MAKAIDSPSVAVERALAILERAAQSADGVSNSALSRALGIPKSSASYILRTLEHRGYLARDPESGKYRLGLKVLSLSRGVLSQLDIRDVARPYLKALVEKTQITCHLAILDAGEAVYIEKVDAPGFVKVDTWVGRRMLIHSTSVGKALVSLRPSAEVESILREHGMEKRTLKTITSPVRYLKELEKVRQLGYAVDDEENNPGARCVAVPVFDSPQQVAAAIGLSGSTAQITQSSVPKLAELMKETSRRISRQLGYSAPGHARQQS